jgi:hypothetical protein
LHVAGDIKPLLLRNRLQLGVARAVQLGVAGAVHRKMLVEHPARTARLNSRVECLKDARSAFCLLLYYFLMKNRLLYAFYSCFPFNFPIQSK